MVDTTSDDWYWDLKRQTAVRAGERRLAHNMLGPYRSRAEAENWQQTAKARNDAWDEEWQDAGQTPDDQSSSKKESDRHH